MSRITKNNRKTAIALSLLLSCGTFATFVNSSATAETTIPVYEDGTEIFEKELFLGAWSEPKLTDEDFQMYKDAGFNAMYIDNAMMYNSPSFKACLDMCYEYGIKAIAMQGANGRAPISIRCQKNSLEDHPAFYGVMMCDEPQGDGTTVSTVKAAIDLTKENGEYKYTQTYDNIYKYMLDEYEYVKANQTFFNNAKYCSVILNEGPNVGDFGYGSTKGYGEQVLANMDPEYRAVEYDKYPYVVLRDGTFSIYKDHLWLNMRIADLCKEYGVGKRVYYYQQYWPTEMREFITVQELTYQLYTAMSFGVNGFVASNWSDYNSLDYLYTNSVWGPREFYYYNQVALSEIKKFDHIYLEFADNWVGIMPIVGSEESAADDLGYDYLTGPNVLSSYQGIESITASQDALVGIMKDSENRTGYMISNQAYTLKRKSNKVKVKFSSAKKALVVENGEAKEVDLIDGVYEVEIGCGSGVFVVPV